MREIVELFMLDWVRIFTLIFSLLFIIGILKTYIDREKIKNKIKNQKGLYGYFLSTILGAVTPFGSSSGAPLFLGLIESGIPLGMAFSFLVTSPLINEYVIILIIGFFGWKVTLAYLLMSMLMGIIAGLVISKLKLEEYVLKDFRKKKFSPIEFKSLKERANFSLKKSKSLIKKIWIFVTLGIALGVAIQNYIPGALIENILSSIGLWGIPLAILIAVPFYGTGSAIIPIAVALFEKGVPIGTALAFLMAVVGLSLPEAKKLRKVMGMRLLLIFFAVVTYIIIVVGYLLNFIKGFF